MSVIRFHMRWWHWLLLMVVVLLLIIVAVALGMRLSGEQRYADMTVDLRAAGKPVTIDDLLATLTPPGKDLQDQWRRWADAVPTYPDTKFSYNSWNRFASGHEDLPADQRRPIEDLRGTMQSARDLLINDVLRIGFAGFIHELAPPEKRTMEESSAIFSRANYDFLASRTLAQWLVHEAAIAIDPRPALLDLDRLVRRFRQPLSLIDSMNLISIQDHRDQAYRTIALQGRLPDDLRVAWAAEVPAAYDGIAAAFETERAVFNDLWARTCLTMSWSTAAFSSDPAGISGDPWTPLQIVGGTWMWATGMLDCATIAEVQAHTSARLRRERLDPISATLDQRMQFVIARISLPNLLMCASTAVKTTASHRIERLAVRLVTDSPRLGLPADEAELLARFGPHSLAAVDDLVALRYERLADDRFRLSIDPGTPVPDFADAALVRSWSVAFGRPAVSDPLTHGGGSLEIQIPAALSRP